MKKILSVLFLVAFAIILTGCDESGGNSIGSDNKVYCTVTNLNNQEDIVKVEIIGELNEDGKLIHMDATYEYVSEEAAKADYNRVKVYYSSYAKQKGKTLEIYNLETTPDNQSVIGMTKEQFIDYLKKAASKETVTCR